jgi:hypothetical protein
MTHITIEKAKLEQALSALKRMASFGNTFGYRSSEQNPYEQVCEAIIAIKQDLALDKMAENARELGLDYEPVQPVAFEVGLVEWVGNKLMATPKVTTTPPASWMEMVTANLVREGVNKHKARELAEHFYGLAQRPFVGLTDEEIIKAVPGGIYDCLNDPWDCGVGDGDTLRSIKKDVLRIARAIEAKLKEKNNG